MDLLKDIRTWRFLRHFCTHAFVFFGVISTFLQTISVIDSSIKFFQSFNYLIGLLIMSGIWGIFRAWPRPITQDFNSPKTKITILKGDILEESTHLVIGTNDTFDTETPNIIARNSLQGQVLDTLYGGDLKELDAELTKALTNKNVVGNIKKAGKQDQYGVGSIATVKQNARLLFFLAYCEMDESNNASSTPDKIWKSLLSLWDEVSKKSNGGVLSIPVIGGGQARISNVLPAQDVIRFIILSFIFASRKTKICDELRIVVTPKDFKKLDRLELQSFLASLRSS